MGAMTDFLKKRFLFKSTENFVLHLDFYWSASQAQRDSIRSNVFLPCLFVDMTSIFDRVEFLGQRVLRSESACLRHFNQFCLPRGALPQRSKKRCAPQTKWNKNVLKIFVVVFLVTHVSALVAAVSFNHARDGDTTNDVSNFFWSEVDRDNLPLFQ